MDHASANPPPCCHSRRFSFLRSPFSTLPFSPSSPLPLFFALLLSACSPPPQASPGLAASPPPPVEIIPGKVVIGTAPWTFEGREGQVIETPSYRIMTTVTRDVILDRLPLFMESALAHYTTALGDLPRPNEQLEVYIMATRPQWARLTQRVMGDDAEMYLRIQRGGFTSAGRAILYDIGPRDTIAIAAHEGWHLYTQKTFRNSLPVTLEEGVATYMEGFRWQGERPNFLPWANRERYEQLVQAERANKLIPLERLMRSTPQELMAQDPDLALTYYAQAWALIHFLNDGQGGRYQPAAHQIFSDAARGRLMAKVSQAVGVGGGRGNMMLRRNVDLLDIYLGKPAATLDDEYQVFIRQIVKAGSRQKIVAGESPL